MNNENKYKDLLTNIYIDTSNIILSLKDLDLEINFESFFIYLKDRFRTKNIYYITPNLEKLNEDLKKIEKVGYKIIKKEIYFQNKIKANCDVEISHYITKDIENNLTEKLVLISGDGDFSILLDYANKKNIKINILSASKKSTAKILRKKKNFKVEYLKNFTKIIKPLK